MIHPPRTMARLLGGVVFLAYSLSGNVRADDKIDFNIPGQALSKSLLDYSEATGVKILLNEDLARGLRNPCLSGRFTNEEGLQKLLESSGLQYRFTSPGAVIIEPPGRESLSTEMLLAKAPKENYPAENVAEKPYTGPVEQLDMTVRGREWNGYNVLNASTATRTDSSILETPVTEQVITRQVIDDQQTITIAETLRNVSGVVPRDPVISPTFEPTLIRGFSAFQYIDGFTQYRNAGDQGSMVNIERIEVVKGANAVLYGGGNGSPVGGIINLVSKMPEKAAFYEIGVKGGLYDFAQPYVDINQPFSDNILFRFTGEYTTNESHIDVLETERYNLNPTITFTDYDATTLTIQGKYSRWEQQDYQGLPAVGTVAGDFNIRPELFIGPADIEKSYSEFSGVWGTLDHRFNDIWSVTVKARYSYSEFDTFAQNTLGADGFGANEPLIPPSTWALINSELYQDHEEMSFQAYATGKFDLGPSRNTVLIGADFSELDDGAYLDAAFLMDANFLPVTVDLMAPTFSDPFTYPGARQPNWFNRNTTYGGYLQLQSTLYERFHLLASVRRGNVTTKFRNTAPGFESSFRSQAERFLPSVGGLFDITDEFSVYANYSEGMRGQGSVNFVSEPKPALSDQVEVGIKFNIAEQLTGQIAAYEIHRKNIAVTDYSDPQLRSVAKGQQRSRGIETNMTWQPLEGLNLLATYAYTDAEFTDDLAGVPAGNELAGVPKHSGRFWAHYDFQEAQLKGLSLGAGVYAQSGAYLSNANMYKSDAYYSMDAAIAYDTGDYKLGISIKNLTDQDYFQWLDYLGTRVSPAQGTTVYFSGSVRFQ